MSAIVICVNIENAFTNHFQQRSRCYSMILNIYEFADNFIQWAVVV